MSSGDTEQENDKELVAAIVIGTTHSNCAFSTKYEYQKDPALIRTSYKWIAGPSNLIEITIPTAVLFDQNKKFHSFGFEAEDKYSELTLDGDNKEWFFFKRFKMKLFDIKEIGRTIEIDDETGKKKMAAKSVFSAAIKYLKNDLLDHLQRIFFSIANEDIHWVITVPAICTDAAKQFMRESAFEAGIDGGQLSIVSEPEAALIYCLISHKDELETSKFLLAGTKYMVIDLGGSRADITVHELQDDGSLKELHKPTGGPWGGTRVDEEFNQLLIRIFGAPVFHKFCEEYKDDYINLQREMEFKKRCARHDTADRKEVIKVPCSLYAMYLDEAHKKVQDAINATPYAGKIICSGDKMRLNASIVNSFFKPCTDTLVAHIRELILKPDVKGTDIFFMVGGFSKSVMMQCAIADAFKDVTVIAPEDQDVVVLKGAVVFGHHPFVTPRESKYTHRYIIRSDPVKHTEDHHVAVKGVNQCRDVFKCHTHEGELIAVNEPRSGKHATSKLSQKCCFYDQKEMTSEEKEQEKDKKLLVAAIDFGTTYSGYAFSRKEEYKQDPTKITINQKWISGSMSFISEKTSTAILFDKDKKFHSFGFDAENKYSDLAAEKVHGEWYFFKRFKMRLHDIKKIGRTTEIEDITGKKKMEAKYVFSEAIKFLKNHLLELLQLRGKGFMNEDIHWVITVPAIWTDAAKQFMREAAFSAGIDGSQLSIALEPEAASIFCQVSHNDELKTSRRVSFSLADPGTKYMVIDLGGGTADITVHERQDDGSLKELHKPTGGPWGGTMVDDEFIQLLIRIIGAPVLQKFREQNVGGYMDLLREIESKKRSITPDTDGKVTITVPSKISMLYFKDEKQEIQDAIDESRYAGQIIWDADKMRLDASIFKGLFKVCIDKLIAHIKELIKEPGVKGTDIFLMVGGFSESVIMQRAIKDTFKDVTVIVPEGAGMTVVKGAVVFGHSPSLKSRISKYTYGINISPPFDPSKHPDDHRVTVGGVDRCRDVFKCYIHEGELIAVNEPRSGKHVTLKPNQREMLLKVYATEKTNPSFVDEDGVEYIGKLVVNLPDSSQKIRVDVRMMFGKTELAVEAIPTIENGSERSEEAKKTCRAYFDFL